ncbi:helix-turn-helix domain-containing protein [Neisseria dumasiana]|uniref:XRE family transcriptional regulator n=1 Tax=Neisseria dumasiana TaxID=1931275 RepID=A0A1X3DLW4_9NEIS|nr:helix-turn-helix transcriptional regulator [Neisseria dumasiana]OSI25095.1 XRE family transcriptional regulator [Neisseria dumasiana]
MDNNFEFSSKSLGERLKKIRNDNGYSRDQLAELFKVSRASIQNYENGERSPNADYLVQFYKFFGINLHWLLTGNLNAYYQEYGDAVSSPREETLIHLSRQLDQQALDHLLDLLMSLQGIKTDRY